MVMKHLLLLALLMGDDLQPKIIYSFNGRTWTEIDFMIGSNYRWNAVIYANGLFVAGGQGGAGNATDIFATSPNGINWTLRYGDVGTEGVIRTVNAITHGNGLFVAVGNNGIIQTSPDGINWTERNTYLYATTGKYVNNMFVALSSTDYHTSSDGLNWTTNNFSGSLIQSFWKSIEYANNIFVAVSNSGSVGYNRIITNGVQSEPLISNFTIPTKTFGESPFTIVAPNSDSDGSFTYTSSDSLVATISENIITIVGAGSTTITATQNETDDFTSGIITTTLIINRETLTNPAIVEDANELNYFLNTTSKYANIINTLVINNNISSSNAITLFSTNHIEITRET